MRVGDPVILRSIYRGNVRWAFPHRYAGEHESGRLALYCQPGNCGKKLALVEGRHDVRGWAQGTAPTDHVWERTHSLRFMRSGDAHTIEVHWNESWEPLCWYVNLQAPLRVEGSRFDTTDQALDIVVDPDGAWAWKDEDELAALVALGAFDEALAAEIRAEGERVIAAKPWPTGWEAWRPPPEWTPLALAEDWDVV